jgi:hypothetical protein
MYNIITGIKVRSVSHNTQYLSIAWVLSDLLSFCHLRIGGIQHCGIRLSLGFLLAPVTYSFPGQVYNCDNRPVASQLFTVGGHNDLISLPSDFVFASYQFQSHKVPIYWQKLLKRHQDIRAIVLLLGLKRSIAPMRPRLAI